MNQSIKLNAVRIWFLFNGFISLFPPLYWVAGAYPKSILGLPASLIYFGGISLSITCSILFAYWQESSSGELSS